MINWTLNAPGDYSGVSELTDMVYQVRGGTSATDLRLAGRHQVWFVSAVKGWSLPRCFAGASSRHEAMAVAEQVDRGDHPTVRLDPASPTGLAITSNCPPICARGGVQMTAFPTAQTVARALRRDAGIITSPHGYEVRQGLRAIAGPTISVVVSDIESANLRKAEDLAAHLSACGWEVKPYGDIGIIEVTKVPTATERRTQDGGRP